ncbi:MAG: hypothetical protein P9L99_14885 [Candidatus Lernaella stagnicola]|nr:hypothetical protein [Candidatus Lernaella stagnicola]
MTTKPSQSEKTRRDLDELLLRLLELEADGHDIDWESSMVLLDEPKPEPEDVDEVFYWRPVPRGPYWPLVEHLVQEKLKEAEDNNNNLLGEDDQNKEVR